MLLPGVMGLQLIRLVCQHRPVGMVDFGEENPKLPGKVVLYIMYEEYIYTKKKVEIQPHFSNCSYRTYRIQYHIDD